MIYRGRDIEILEWISIVREELKNGLIIFTIPNKAYYKFDKEKFREIDSNFMDYLF